MFFFAIHFGWKLRELAVAITLDRISHRGEPLGGGCPPKRGFGGISPIGKVHDNATDNDNPKATFPPSFFMFCCVEIFEVVTEKNFTATK